MKRTLFIFLIISLSYSAAYSQKSKFSAELGFMYLRTDAVTSPEALYGANGYDPMGVSAKVTATTKWDFLDLCIGAYRVTHASDYYSGDGFDKFRSGGVYIGVSPKWKTKYFGITSDFAVGAMGARQIKEVPSSGESKIYSVDRGSTGLGAYMSLGFYVKYKRFSLNPVVCCIITGGDASYMLTGFNIPLVYHF